MWFEGDVTTAIRKAKSENKLFVVYIEGEDEVSVANIKLLDSLAPRIQDKIVALKLTAGSPSEKQFRQVFPVLVVPSLYVIHNGQPIYVCAGDIKEKTEELVGKILQLCPSDVASVESVDTTSAPPPNSSASCSQPSPEQAPSSSQGSSLSLDEKVRIAKEKLDQLNRKKAQEEAEREKNKEKERIEALKNLSRLKREAEEREMNDIRKERDNDKLLEKQARERVLAQIAQDREDRKRREQQKIGLAEPKKLPQVPQATVSTSDSAKIQFRFPNGEVMTHDFRPNDKFEEARKHIRGKSSLRNFSLSTTYPRKVFSGADYEATFSELALLPSSTLLVTPASTSTVSEFTGTNSFWNYLWFLFMPFLSIYNFIISLWPSTPPPPPASTSDRNAPSSVPSDANRTTKPETKSTSRNPNYGRPGNMARLSDIRPEESDDDNNTWNGNSTQQQ